VIEQKHISNARADFVDFEMFIPCDIAPNGVVYARISKVEEVKEPPQQSRDSNTELSVEGVSEEGEIIFQFMNKN